jgi:hypothetical protein
MILRRVGSIYTDADPIRNETHPRLPKPALPRGLQHCPNSSGNGFLNGNGLIGVIRGGFRSKSGEVHIVGTHPYAEWGETLLPVHFAVGAHGMRPIR